MPRCNGAQTSPEVSRAVDYLVIGSPASPDWRYTRQGRKTEKTLQLKRRGSILEVITARRLLGHLRVESHLMVEPA